MALPAFTDSGGPVPGVGARGTVLGDLPDGPEAKASLAALYCAQMTTLTLGQLGGAAPIVVDGVFAENAVFMALLAAFLPERPVVRSLERQGTALGAASLALPEGHGVPDPRCEEDAPADLDGLAAYHAQWLDRVASL